MADKSLQKDTFGKDLDKADEAIDVILQPMIMVILMLVLMSMLPMAQTAQKYFESQLYQGQPDSRTLYATGAQQHVVLPNPWVGAFFINDGPSTVEIRINNEGSFPYILGLNETRTVSRLGADNRIYAIYYNCYPGGKATVRVDGVY